MLSASLELPRLLPNNPTLVTFAVDTTGSKPGKYTVSMSVTGVGRDGVPFQSSAEGRVFVAQSFPGFFGHLGDEDTGVKVPRSWTNVAPEGSVTTEILEYHDAAPGEGGAFPVALRMSVVPQQPYRGQFSPIPFEDPLWKALGAAIAEASVTELVGAAVVGTVVGVGAGAAVGAGTNASKGAAVATGVVVAVAVTGIILMLADGEDVFLWGERQTPVDDDEYTIREEGEARLIADGTPPSFGEKREAKAEWIFRRITNKRTLTATKIMPLEPAHYTTGRRVHVSERALSAGRSVHVTARFEKDGHTLRGSDLYVVAALMHGDDVVATFPLSDDGAAAATGAGDGSYVGDYLISEEDPVGEWGVMVFAQDVNHADPADPPLKQAEHLGGILVSAPEMDAGFRLIPDARINVVEEQAPTVYGELAAAMAESSAM